MKRIYWIFLFLGLVACTKEIDFTGTQTDPLMVVNGLQRVGQPVYLCVEKSVFFLGDQTDCRAKEVHVDLYVNGVFRESLQVRDSLEVEEYYEWVGDTTMVLMERLRYAFNYCEGQYVPQAGDRLRFEVCSSEFEETAEAEVTMPEPPTVVGFDTLRVEYPLDEPRRIYFSLTVDDPEGADYYNLCPWEGLTGFASSDPVFADLTSIDMDGLFGESSDYYAYGPYNVFNDAYFNGRTYSVSMNVYSYWDEFYERYVVEVSRVDEALYQFKRTYEAYCDSDPESLIGMFTEPVRVYTNVKNGIGVVGAQSEPVTLVIDLTE